MRPLPAVDNLKTAVGEVIASNTADGYPPTYFLRATLGGHAPDLLARCTALIMKPETFDILTDAVQRFPTLLTLEDFVARHGAAWGFRGDVIEQSAARATHFDNIAGEQRYL